MTKIDKELIFAKGRAYGQLEINSRQRIFFGYDCLAGALLFTIINIPHWELTSLGFSLVFSALGASSLYIGYSDKQKMRSIK